MNSRSFENFVTTFEESVDSADRKLDQLAWRIDKLEVEKRNFSAEEESSEATDEELLLLRELITELDKVKKNYASLRSELEEVHIMHADLTNSLRQQLIQVQNNFTNLRTRFTSHCNGKAKVSRHV